MTQQPHRWFYPILNVLAILVLVPLCAARDALADRLKGKQ